MKNEITKSKHAAGGYTLKLSEKGNTRFGAIKKDLIVSALKDSSTDGVYITTKGNIKIQLLNGSSKIV